ncbi:sodium:proton antiporter [Micromonospora sp. NPDC049559]|uniref:sodium:proton antiporter n=1 Tax=Micromonospora sp. NPDC049559 TaxID=3155923 RepID=UPI00341E66DB
MRVLAYGVAGWLVLVGALGIVRSHNLVHTAVSLSVSQSGTYVLLLAVGYQWDAPAPVFSPGSPVSLPVVDPVVQALAFTDIVVSATVTALLLALAIQVDKTHRTVDPDRLQSLRG